ncbi:MAG: YebC/PmpR family DNA-binding transcriptional regulator [Roseibacillus sp.]|jgi:YebC/PmpR family DNA-binding regulatory protein|nr:YebC/PmpR family DNA-binding transcriptional regulator [Roseibacillus sp.]MBP35477.1 YebC/PmpR family DNA-binding transcriptional regulator [Roseibacillus sp.]MCP4732536.1 YebC/PmpR family DNA-binding transcriptional regulator [Roseibacillus sp.]MDP7307820.1 YebC/PmpR family DNA-binding transcriptional regulator [Roseibacillus sp.]HJM64772.1 YebC/PmpR family DNA-binding transcriptional regulator [Roseibacillus sp.]|tara:strand:- start:6604 stop:7314 length:711 start_codon:yes stop_codon:yes gene_type:complete
MGRAFEYRRAAKEKRWDKMSKVFPKLARTITMAAKEGGVDPDSNSRLRTAILNAKAQNMPKDNIETAIKRAAGKDMAEISEVNYEAKGPHGVMLFIETATDNTNRTISNVRTPINKAGGEILNSGSLQFLFDRKAVIQFERKEGDDLEEIELELIDHGLEEMEENEGTVFVYGDFTNFGSLSQACEKLGIELSKAGLQRIPNNPQEFSEGQLDEIESLIDKLEDDEDVQAVYTNVA